MPRVSSLATAACRGGADLEGAAAAEPLCAGGVRCAVAAAVFDAEVDAALLEVCVWVWDPAAEWDPAAAGVLAVAPV